MWIVAGRRRIILFENMNGGVLMFQQMTLYPHTYEQHQLDLVDYQFGRGVSGVI